MQQIKQLTDVTENRHSSPRTDKPGVKLRLNQQDAPLVNRLNEIKFLILLKQGYTLFFFFLLKNIDCGYPLEPPRFASQNAASDQCLHCLLKYPEDKG